VAKPQSAGLSGLSKYYPVSEDDVIPGLREIRRNINNADLSAKTDIEKYDWLENQFIDVFGKDFLMARNLNLPSSMYYIIGVEFNDQLNKHIDNPAQVNRERLHGDASTGEIQNSIRDKFPEQLTNRDLFLMVNEMRNVGVLDSDALRSLGVDGARRFMDTLNLLWSYARHMTQSDDPLSSLSFEERDARWMNVLDKPFSMTDLLRLFNAWSTNNSVTMSPNTGSFIAQFLIGATGNNGPSNTNSSHNSVYANGSAQGYEYGQAGHYESAPGVYEGVQGPSAVYGNGSVGASNNDEEEKDWDAILSMMLTEMDEYDELIRSRMQMIDEPDYTEAEKVGNDPETGEVDESPESDEAAEDSGPE